MNKKIIAKSVTETKEIVILDFFKILMGKFELETDLSVKNRIAYQLNEQFNISKIHSVFLAADIDKKMSVESAVMDMKFRYAPELEKEMIDYLNARPRNDAIAGLLIDNILGKVDESTPEKYYTLEGLKLLNSYFNDNALAGNEQAKVISEKMKDQDKYLQKFMVEKEKLETVES